MRKLLFILLVFINILTISSCGKTELVLPNISNFYDFCCDSYRLSEYQNKGKFEYGKWLNGVKIDFNEGDYIVGFICIGYNKNSYAMADLINKDYIIESNIISPSDMAYFNETLTCSHYSIGFFNIDNKLRVGIFEGDDMIKYIMFDCYDDLGLMDAINQMSLQYDYDIIGEMKENSKILLNPDTTKKDLEINISPMLIYINELQLDGYKSFLIPYNQTSFEGDILFQYPIMDAESSKVIDELTYELFYSTEE